MPPLKNPDLYKTLQTWVDQLKLDPTNTDLRAKILTTQVYATGQQLGVSDTQAANVVKGYTAAYAKSQNIDPKSVLEQLSVEEQNILNYSKSNPTLYGVDLSTANKLASYLGIGSGVLLTAAIAVFTVALFTVGPEIAAGIGAAEGVVGTIGAALGSPLIATGGFLFLLSQFLGHLSSGIPMMTKQMIDNGSIGPGLRISALTQAEELKAKLSGTASPGSFTGSQFSDYAKGIETQNPISIKNPCTVQTVPYSRDELANLVQCIFGKQATTGGKTTATKLIPLLAPYIILKGGNQPIVSQTTSNAISPNISIATKATSIPTTKVFTGIVSQGVVGAGLSFTARPDDMIESVEELRTAAANNLAPYLVSLPSKIVYEVKVVSSITTKDGFKQTGITQKIQTGTHKNGTPIYKTVTNKFATLILYAMTDKGSKAKLTTIVLGPVDSAKLTVGQNDLQTLQDQLPSLVTTTNINDIQGIQTNTPIATIPQTTQTAPITQPIVQIKKRTWGFALDRIKNPGNTPAQIDEIGYAVIDALTQEYTTFFPEDVLGWKNWSGNIQSMRLKFSQFLNGTLDPAHSQVFKDYMAKVLKDLTDQASAVDKTTISSAGTIKAGNDATTLSAWYAAQGSTLPTIEERSKTYETLALGPKSYYTGTAEQNTNLLNALKMR